MKVIGRTTYSLTVVSGVFKYYDTHGIPLDTVLETLQTQNYMPDWLDFILEATKAGWTKDTILSRLESPIIDVYGKAFYNEWLIKLNSIWV